MKAKQSGSGVCDVCRRTLPARELVSGALVRPTIADVIRADHPTWSSERAICRDDLATYRGRYVSQLLESERGDLTALEREVVDSLREHEVLSSNVDVAFERDWTFGERLADRIATFGGSWAFLIFFASFLAVWIGANTVALWRPPLDPFPYILLNLVLSCLAAIQAPIIMMSQNRQEAKDRLRSQHDYQVNLKAELEIRQLHEKIDHLLSHQWERLVEMQQIQLELLTELGRRS